MTNFSKENQQDEKRLIQEIFNLESRLLGFKNTNLTLKSQPLAIQLDCPKIRQLRIVLNDDIDPSSTNHSFIDPSSTNHSFINHSSTNHSFIDPSSTNHSFIDPSSTNHSFIDPSSTNHSFIDPSSTNHHSFIDPSPIDYSSVEYDDPYSSIRSIVLKKVRNLEILEEYIFDRNSEVRLSVLKSMGNCPFDIKKLCHLINDSCVAVRVEFCKLLGKNSTYDEELILQLIRMFDKENEGTFIFGAEDESVEVRKEMIKSLGILILNIISNSNKSTNINNKELNKSTNINNKDNQLNNINEKGDKSINIKKECSDKSTNINNKEGDKSTNIINESNKSINIKKESSNKLININNKEVNKYTNINNKECSDKLNNINEKVDKLNNINKEVNQLINLAFGFLCDMLNDDSLAVRILSMKLLYKISKKYPIEKDISEMFGMILCFKEKNNKIKKYLLKTVSYLYYKDLSMMEYLFKNERFGITEVIKRIIKRNKALFIEKCNNNFNNNGFDEENVIGLFKRKNGSFLYINNTSNNSNNSNSINNTSNSNSNSINNNSNSSFDEDDIIGLSKRKKCFDPFLFSTSEDRKKYNIRYIADLLVFSILKFQNLNDQILTDMKGLEKMNDKKKINDVSELEILLSILFASNDNNSNDDNNNDDNNNDKGGLDYKDREKNCNDKIKDGYDDRIKDGLKNTRFITSVAKFIKESLLSNPSLLSLIPYKFKFPIKVFKKIKKKYNSPNTFISNTFISNNFIRKILKTFIRHCKYSKIKDYSFKVMEKDALSFLPLEFSVTTECKYLTKHDMKTVKFIAESDGKYILYDLNKNINVQIDSKRKGINFFIGIVDETGEILKLA